MADRPEDAERIIARGLNVNPDNGWLKLAQGAVHIMRKDSAEIKEAEELLRKEVRDNGGDPWVEEHFMGVMYCWAKDSLTASGYFRKAWEMDPERMNSLGFLIACQLESNVNLEECLRLADIRLAKMPDSVFSWFYKGSCLFKLGRYEESLVCLREAQNREIAFFVKIKQYISMAEQALALQVQQ